MKKSFAAIALIVITGFFLSPPATGQELTLSGSTTVQKRILEPASKAIESSTGIRLNIRGINTGKGFEALRSGRIQASIASSPLNLILEKAGISDDGTYVEHVIVKDVIVPIVHRMNPVNKLSWEQLAAINTGKITNWKEVGGPNQKIVVITSQPTAATRRVFQKIVMKKKPYIQGAREVRSTRQEVDLVAKFRGGIGAVSEGFVQMNKNKVKVIQTKSISRPLSIITKGVPTKDVQTIINFLRKPETKKLFN